MKLIDFLNRFETGKKFFFNYWIVDVLKTSINEDYSFDGIIKDFIERCVDEKYSFLLDIIMDSTSFHERDGVLTVDYCVIV